MHLSIVFTMAGRAGRPQGIEFFQFTLVKFPSQGQKLLSNSLLSEPNTIIKDQYLNGQVPQTLDAIICQISAPQAANPINFLRVACPPVVETLHRCITTICILCNQSATSVQNGHYM